MYIISILHLVFGYVHNLQKWIWSDAYMITKKSFYSISW